MLSRTARLKQWVLQQSSCSANASEARPGTARAHQVRGAAKPGAKMGSPLGNEYGFVTVEAALSMSALVIVAVAIIAGVVAVAGYLQAVQTAGAAARAHAIGVGYSAPRGTVDITQGGGLATATARIPTPLGELAAQAVFPVETEQ